jgi:hypothetical protein
MTTFIDGPAKGQHLRLHFSPQYLRVTEGANGKWDALDDPNDTALPEERIHVYELHEHLGMCHINAGRGRGGFYPIASYREVALPSTNHLRLNPIWDEWVAARAHAL